MHPLRARPCRCSGLTEPAPSLPSSSERSCPSARISLCVDSLWMEPVFPGGCLCAWFVCLFVLIFPTLHLPFLGCSLAQPSRSAPGRPRGACDLLGSRYTRTGKPETRPLEDGCFPIEEAHCRLRMRALCGDCSSKTRKMHIYFCNLVGIPF